MKKTSIEVKLLLLLGLLAGAGWLLRQDAGSFYRWWLAILFLGIACYPLTAYVFEKFVDRGWLVSKVFGIAGAGFLTWFFVNCHILRFTSVVCVAMTLALAVGNWIWYFLKKRKEANTLQIETISAWLDHEIVFVLFFLLWTYFAGFRPEAYGTEKFMDYGFMMAMMRSETLPAPDLWFAGGNINYYYGGQYFAVFLTKLTGTRVAETYHLMRTLVAGLAFSLPFVLIRQMLLDHLKKEQKHREGYAVLGGILAGTGVSLAGNMHYVMVGKILPMVRELLKLPPSEHTYWFPNSTRYIGYYPEGNDKTIHEFPSYSFVLGDLHAHVVNVMFVLAVICLIYACVQMYRKRVAILIFSFFIGLFHWTNYWDFVIYFVMGGMGIIYCNYLQTESLKLWKNRWKKTLLVSIFDAGIVFVLGTLFALPFTMQFQTMVSGVALAQNHSRPYQWWLIWGLQLFVTLLFFFCVFRGKKKEKRLPGRTDCFCVILGISAIGLIVIPELVYVKDIYEAEFARSNTMFKLTYQAFIMFGLVMSYAFVRIWTEQKHRIEKTMATAGFICFMACSCYIGTAVHSWFGQIWERERYQGLDATAFLETTFPEDAGVIRWLNDEVEGNPVVLEAQGDSYSDYERISAMTGLPTVLGWYVHEWLWRGDVPEINQRMMDVELLYTSTDYAQMKSLLEEYDISYIYVGAMERTKYPAINEAMIQSQGMIVYQNETGSSYLVKVGTK